MIQTADMLRAGIHNLLLVVTLPLLLISAAGTGAASELAELEQERNRLEREIAQYKASISLLRANGADFDTSSMRILAGELNTLRGRLAEITARERALSGPTATASDGTAGDDDATRMATLLRQHYAREQAAEAQPRETVPDTEALLEQVTIDRGKIRLSGTEGVTALSLFSERLANSPADAAQRTVDEVLHVEIRQGGRLVSSSTHGLRALGRAQYIGKLSLPTGDVSMRVRSKQWSVELTGSNAADYLVTLHAPRDGKAQLHLIPVEELKATRWPDIPAWVPDLGAANPATT